MGRVDEDDGDEVVVAITKHSLWRVVLRCDGFFSTARLFSVENARRCWSLLGIRGRSEAKQGRPAANLSPFAVAA